MEMINRSKIWRCLEIFALSYLVFKREVLLQAYCGVDNFSSWLVFQSNGSSVIFWSNTSCSETFQEVCFLQKYWEHMWFYSFAYFTESLYGHSGVFLSSDNVIYYFVNLNF